LKLGLNSGSAALKYAGEMPTEKEVPEDTSAILEELIAPRIPTVLNFCLEISLDGTLNLTETPSLELVIISGR